MSATTAEDFKYSCSSQNMQTNPCFGTDNTTTAGNFNFDQQLSHLLPPIINTSHHQYPSSSSSSFLTSSYPLANPQNPLSQSPTATNTNGICGGSFAARSSFSTLQPQQQHRQGDHAMAFGGGYGQTSVVGPDVADRAAKGANTFWIGESNERGVKTGYETRSSGHDGESFPSTTTRASLTVDAGGITIPQHFKRSRFHGEYEGLVTSSPNDSAFGAAPSSSHVDGGASGTCVSEGDAALAAGMLPPPLQTIRGLEVEGFDSCYRGGGAKTSQHNNIECTAENGNRMANTCMTVPVSESAAQGYVNDTHFLHIPPGTVGFEYYEPPLSRFRADTNKSSHNNNDGGYAHLTANSSNSTNASGYRNPKEVVVVEASEYTRRGGADCQSGSTSPIPAGAASFFSASTNNKSTNSNNNNKAVGSSNSLPSASRSSVGYTSHACTPTPSPSAATAVGPLGGVLEAGGTSPTKDGIRPHSQGLVPPPKPKSAHSAGDPRVWELTEAEAAALMGKAAGAELLKGEDDASAADFYLCRCAPPIRKNPAGFPRDTANCYTTQENEEEEGAEHIHLTSGGPATDEDDEATDNNNTSYTATSTYPNTIHNSGANSIGACAAAPTGSCENSTSHSSFFDIKSGAEAKVQKCTCCGGWRLVVLSNSGGNSSSVGNNRSTRGYGTDQDEDDGEEEEVLSPTSAASHKAVTAVIKSLITNRPMHTDSRILHKILRRACGISSSSSSSGACMPSGIHCPTTTNNSTVFPCYPNTCVGGDAASSSSGSSQQQPLLLTWSGVPSREVPGRKRVRVTAVSTDSMVCPSVGQEHTSHFVNNSYGPSSDANGYFPIPSLRDQQQQQQWSSQLHNGGGACVSAAAGGIPIDGDEGFGFVAFKKNRQDDHHHDGAGSPKGGFFPATTNAPVIDGRSGVGCDSDDVN